MEFIHPRLLFYIRGKKNSETFSLVAVNSFGFLVANQLNKFWSYFGWYPYRTIVFVEPNYCSLCFQNRLQDAFLDQHNDLQWNDGSLKFTENKPLDLATWKWNDRSKFVQLRSRRSSPSRQTCLHSNRKKAL